MKTREIHETNIMEEIFFTADVGGSHITVGIFDQNTYNIDHEKVQRVKVDSKGSQHAILSAWFEAFDRLIDACGMRPNRIAFAMPGPFDYVNGISLIKGVDKYESLYQVDIRASFAEHYSLEPHNIIFRNDAEAFLHGEVLLGDFIPQSRFLGLTLGTGFGSAYSTGGCTKDLALGLSPYKESIADDYLSTRWFKRRADEVIAKDYEVKELVGLAAEGDKDVLALFDEFALHCYNVTSDLVKNRNVDYIIIGGNIGKAYPYFLPKLYQLYADSGIKVNIVMAKLGEYSAMMGSALSFDPQPTEESHG